MLAYFKRANKLNHFHLSLNQERGGLVATRTNLGGTREYSVQRRADVIDFPSEAIVPR